MEDGKNPNKQKILSEKIDKMRTLLKNNDTCKRLAQKIKDYIKENK